MYNPAAGNNPGQATRATPTRARAPCGASHLTAIRHGSLADPPTLTAARPTCRSPPAHHPHSRRPPDSRPPTPRTAKPTRTQQHEPPLHPPHRPRSAQPAAPQPSSASGPSPHQLERPAHPPAPPLNLPAPALPPPRPNPLPVIAFPRRFEPPQATQKPSTDKGKTKLRFRFPHRGTNLGGSCNAFPSANHRQTCVSAPRSGRENY
jgi:hypothetical protein